jgi:hypothetical protein
MGADIQRGHTYSNGDTVNETNLHALVDDATIKSGAVTNDKLGALSVSAGKLQSDAVETAKIAADAVTGDKIADDAVDSEHIAAGAIDLEHLSDAVRPTNYDFAPATPYAAGTKGLVPAPSAGEQNALLRGDGTWQDATVEATAAVTASPIIAFHNHLQFS